jgi:hypothetical protein
MARYIGNTSQRNPNEEAVEQRTIPFSKATGITTDSSNRVTFLRVGNRSYNSISYDTENRITAFTETIYGLPQNFTVSYDTDGNIVSITKV